MKFYRNLWSREWHGFDSIQGMLEEAHNYDEYDVILHFDPEDANRPKSPLFNLKELDRGGYVNLSLVSETDFEGRETLRLAQLSLTIAGRKLLEELRQKSRWGVLTRKAAELLWIVVVSVVTTLVTLWIREGN